MKVLRIILVILSTYLIIGGVVQFINSDFKIAHISIGNINSVVTTVVVVLLVVMNVVRILISKDDKNNK